MTAHPHHHPPCAAPSPRRRGLRLRSRLAALLPAAALPAALLLVLLAPAHAHAAIPTMSRPACMPELHPLPPSDRAALG